MKVDDALLGDGPVTYGDDTPLILPSKKRKTTQVKEQAPAKKFLSKKQRRQLECVVDRKKKKEKVCCNWNTGLHCLLDVSRLKPRHGA